MRFCPDCDNILLPVRDKMKIYCKACDKEFKLDPGQQADYKIVKTIRHEDSEVAPIIIKEVLKRDKISDQDRKAFEEFFSGE